MHMKSFSQSISLNFREQTLMPPKSGFQRQTADNGICKKVKAEFDFSELDTFLVVKDIVYRIYKKQNEKLNTEKKQEETKI